MALSPLGLWKGRVSWQRACCSENLFTSWWLRSEKNVTEMGEGVTIPSRIRC